MLEIIMVALISIQKIFQVASYLLSVYMAIDLAIQYHHGRTRIAWLVRIFYPTKEDDYYDHQAMVATQKSSVQKPNTKIPSR